MTEQLPIFLSTQLLRNDSLPLVIVALFASLERRQMASQLEQLVNITQRLTLPLGVSAINHTEL